MKSASSTSRWYMLNDEGPYRMTEADIAIFRALPQNPCDWDDVTKGGFMVIYGPSLYAKWRDTGVRPQIIALVKPPQPGTARWTHEDDIAFDRYVYGEGE